MYKICLIIAFFSAQFMVAQEKTRNYSISSEIKDSEIQNDTIASKMEDSNHALKSANSTAEPYRRAYIKSENIRESPIRRRSQKEIKNRTEIELKKESDTISN